MRARESQLVTKVSTLRNQETELHGQLQNFHQEKTRINARVNQIHNANNSMDTRNMDVTQQLQTSNIETSHLQVEASDLRSSVEKWRIYTQWTSNGHCSRGDSCRFKHDSDKQRGTRKETEKATPKEKDPVAPVRQENRISLFAISVKKGNAPNDPHVILGIRQNAPSTHRKSACK